MPVGTYRTATLSDLQRSDGWAPIRLELGIQSLGINAWTAVEAGTAVIGEHDEVPSEHEEVYVVTAGHATFTVDGVEIDAPAGTIVFVPDPSSKRGAVARDAGTTVLTVGGKPGAAYKPRAWETNADVFAAFERGDHAEVKRLTLAALAIYEDRGPLLYNLACSEAQLGDLDAAFEHLREAIAERSDLRALAVGDDDLAPLRGDPRFDEITSA